LAVRNELFVCSIKSLFDEEQGTLTTKILIFIPANLEFHQARFSSAPKNGETRMKQAVELSVVDSC
jgi:hypothetical protein